MNHTSNSDEKILAIEEQQEEIQATRKQENLSVYKSEFITLSMFSVKRNYMPPNCQVFINLDHIVKYTGPIGYHSAKHQYPLLF